MNNFSTEVGGSVLDRTILNSVQREAVEYNDGPQLVFAGAGTGKTRVLTAKIAYLIENGFYPGQILAATFTNKAAREMRDRVEKLLGMPMEGLWIGTFHSLCARVLRREARHVGYIPGFTIYDRDDQIALVKKILKSFGIDDRTMQPKEMLGRISHYKNKCIPPETVNETAMGFYEKEVARIYTAYQKALHELHAMDFDDLISNTVYLFRKNPEVLKRYQGYFKYVLVDEYQDTNAAQFILLKLLTMGHRFFFAVGDDDQSIYGWRGAQIKNILSFEKEFPETRVFKLEQNYRSSKAILDFANATIVSNSSRVAKQLWTERDGGSGVVITKYYDDRQEAEMVAEKIASLINRSFKGGDIAVLFRTNAQSRVFEDSFRRRRISYVLVGGISFYERAEIKNCLAYLRLLVNAYDDMSFERIMNIPARGLGEKAKENIRQLARKHGSSMLQVLLSGYTTSMNTRYQKNLNDLKDTFALLIDLQKQNTPPHHILNEVLHLTGYIDSLTSEESEEASGRLENINELVNALAMWHQDNPDKGLDAFLEEVTLVSDIDKWNKSDDAVNLMTLHCAKGLEFKVVFLVGVEDGILPSRLNFDDEEKIEEERRLLYVGATRAMDILECSHVELRHRFGDIIPSIPSRFLDSIPTTYFSSTDNSSFFGQPPVQPRKAPKKEHRKNRWEFDQSISTRQTAPKPSSCPPVPTTPSYDEFSQDTVEYRMGQQVVHKVYGRGKIVNISGFGDDMKMTVLFNNGTRKKLMAKFANFESPE